MGDTSRIYHTPQGDPLYRGNSYETSKAICNETRMERLQRELFELIHQLPNDTKISLGCPVLLVTTNSSGTGLRMGWQN